MNLRKHQQDFKNIIAGIIAGSGVKKIYVHVTPGGGKSLLPILAGKLITAGLANALCWIVPRLALSYQAETNFAETYFRKMLKHNLSIRSSTNAVDPCRGLCGFVTTFSAVGVDEKQTVLNDFLKKRYILILDEGHHVPYESISPWYQALKPLVEKAKYLVFLSGTMARRDEKQIAFVPYKQKDMQLYPDLRTNDTTDVVTYTRQDALKEKAILPLSFHLSTGSARWIDKNGTFCEANISSAPKGIASQALFTALSTEFAETLLESGIKHWQSLKTYNKGAKLLIVTANYEEAKRISKKLNEKRLNHKIATSHESAKAQMAIMAFRNGSVNILVTIAMAYEGLSINEITHIICLTNIRSIPWIEQMIARAVRIDPQAGAYETQTGFIFGPDDIMFREIVSKIEREQKPFIKMKKKTPLNLFLGNGEGEGVPNIQIQPLSSTMNGQREVFLGERPPMKIHIPQTPSEIESSLRCQIEKHVRLYSYNNRYQNKQINAEIKNHSGKARSEMTSDELANAYEWIQKMYPIERVGRGSGRQRVPGRARIWP